MAGPLLGCEPDRDQPRCGTWARALIDRLLVRKTPPILTLGHRIGHLDVKDIERVDQAILIFLGLGG